MADTTVDNDLKTVQQVEACGFEVFQRKGKGTFGLVYEVGDANGTLFAFKYILPNESYKLYGLDSLNEIDILSRVYHPYIIHASKIVTPQNCQIDGIAVVLPLADRTLYDIIADIRTTTEMKLPILYKLTTGLEFLHRSNILHLDIKSTNVVLQDINENYPYFIDFGLSMIVDNISIGKYDRGLRVTLDHRAPEILAGSRIYNGPVDIWAFGIMLLYVLSGRAIFRADFTKITEKELYNIIIEMFSDTSINKTLSSLLIGVRAKYHNLCIDLLTKILNIDPSKRITAKEICDHPIFNEFKINVEGILDNPPIQYNYSQDHRDILKLLIHWAKTIYSESRAEVLFLAVDLFNRLSSSYNNNEAIDRMNLAATCLWASAKLTNSKLIPLNIYVSELNKMVPDIANDKILEKEIEIISLTSGVLYVSNLYHACDNGDELKLTFSYVILDRDSTLYARTDVQAWKTIMKTLAPTPIYKDKNITIKQLME